MLKVSPPPSESDWFEVRLRRLALGNAAESCELPESVSRNSGSLVLDLLECRGLVRIDGPISGLDVSEARLSCCNSESYFNGLP